MQNPHRVLTSLAQSRTSAEGAQYESQGQARSASPLGNKIKKALVALKGRNRYLGLSGLDLSLVFSPGASAQRVAPG